MTDKLIRRERVEQVWRGEWEITRDEDKEMDIAVCSKCRDETVDRECVFCKWWDGVTWICCNGESEECAGETWPDGSCPQWEAREGKEEP